MATAAQLAGNAAPSEAAQCDDRVVPAGAPGYESLKRALDVVGACILLVVLSPVMLLTAAAIKLTSRGPALFRQVRAGRGGKPFTMYKFRSMRNGAQEQRPLVQPMNVQAGPVFKIPDDPRVTRVGRFLRRSSIDELPQLINVLRGEMSLVGPRPLWLPEAQAATGAARYRTAVKPGLTCLWQISGRSELGYDEWVRLDLYYITHRSTWLDLLVLVQTLPVVLSARGAY
ncbi:MAG: sugar transferase [Phycisphaerae bacterium]|nr:sugar transferase [Phycisphaerae bacterium]